jgi:hypothetical protein
MVGIDERRFMVREQSTNKGGEDERCVGGKRAAERTAVLQPRYDEVEQDRWAVAFEAKPSAAVRNLLGYPRLSLYVQQWARCSAQ